MYRLLVVTNEPAVLERVRSTMDWDSLNFNPPMIVETAQQAIDAMETKRVDCVAYLLESMEARKLRNYLNNIRPSLPVFEIRRTPEAQIATLHDMRKVLDRLHGDYSDEAYDEKAIMSMLRDELIHDLLAGEITNEKVLRGRLEMLRSHLSLTKQCVVYEFDLP